MPEDALNNQPPHELALQQLRKENATPEEKLKAAFYIIQHNHFDHFKEATESIAPFEAQFSRSVEWLYCMGYGLVTQQMPAAAIPYLIRTIGCIQNDSALYTYLTWAHLQVYDYGNAFLTSSAGLQNCPEKGILPNLNYLSKVLHQGYRSVSFEKHKQTIQFSLFSSNTQEIDAALNHLAHRFTETDELEMIRKHVGPVDSIAEIGCLVGNHSVYFLKFLTPRRLKVIDASKTSLEHAKTNLEMNLESSRRLEVDFVHSAVGNRADTLTFFGERVPLNALDTLLQEPFDFLKIDVDSMELEALEGAKNYLMHHKPKVMIEVLHILKTPFEDFLETIGYHIVDQVDTKEYSNYLIGPR